MARYIVNRILIVFVVLWAVATLTFFTLHITPGDTANAVLISIYGPDVVSPETLEAMRTHLDLDRPIHQQYFDWLMNVLRGDLGTSYKYGKPVSYMLAVRLPNTVLLGTVSFLFATLVAIPLGIFSALKHNRPFDHLSRGVTMLLSSFPSFWVAIVLIIVFSIHLKMFPVSGMRGPASIVLPVLTLSMGMVATVTRMMRSSMLDVMGQDYVVIARAKGLSENTVINRHMMRNAISPIVTVAGLQIGHILGGSVIVENIFAWPGVGGLLMDSVNAKDMPMLEGCVLLIACGYAVVNLLVDIVYVFIDPRVRYGGA